MPDGNRDYDWREGMRHENSVERKSADHERVDREIDELHAGILEQGQRIEKLIVAMRDLIDRIPPENLR